MNYSAAIKAANDLTRELLSWAQARRDKIMRMLWGWWSI